MVNMRAEIISIDDFKETLPGYTPEHAERFHSSSAKLANQAFKSALAEPRYNEVILLSGGSASGKTEYLHTFLEDAEAIIFDSTLSTIEGARIKLLDSIKSGKTPQIHAVIPDDIKRAFIAFLNRDRRFSDEAFYRTHAGARSTLLWIAQEYPDIKIQLIESSYQNDALKFKLVEFDSKQKQIEYLYSIQYNEAQIIQEVTS